MSLRVQEFHDCPSIRPDMVVGTEEITQRNGIWPFTRTEVIIDRRYDTRNAEWTCPVCKSTWDYRPSFKGRMPGFWSAITRNSVWKEV